MANSIKEAGDGRLALQATKHVRSAGLVEENNESEATYLADTRVYAFDDLLLVVDRDTDRVPDDQVAELVASAARDSKSVYQAINATVSIAGGGYRIQLPPAADAGFQTNQTPHVQVAPGILVLHRTRSERLASDLVWNRRQQVNERMNHS